MEKTVLIDTNMYLDDANVINKLAIEYNKILIPITVLQELDKKKYDRDISYSARNAIRSILHFMYEQRGKLLFDIESYEDIVKADDKILESAKKFGATVATKDISMHIKAEAMGLDTLLHDAVLNGIFKPYINIEMDALHELTKKNVFAYLSEYSGIKYDTTLEIFSDLCETPLIKDAWWFIFINTGKPCPVIYANNPMEEKLIRIDDKPMYRELKTEGTTIKTRDHYQICAVYALEEAPHVLITGKWGSGKSILTSAYAIEASNRKVFITRPPVGISGKYEIGFLPGSVEEKMSNWLGGFQSALYYIYGNTNGQGSDSSYDYVKNEIFDKKFEILPLNSIQGVSLLEGDILILDEAQLVNIDYMSMVLSRPSENSKLIITGDLKQTYDVVKPSESGLLKLLRVLPHKYMAYVELQNSYRSPLLEVADKLQDKSIG